MNFFSFFWWKPISRIGLLACMEIHFFVEKATPCLFPSNLHNLADYIGTGQKKLVGCEEEESICCFWAGAGGGKRTKVALFTSSFFKKKPPPLPHFRRNFGTHARVFPQEKKALMTDFRPTLTRGRCEFTNLTFEKESERGKKLLSPQVHREKFKSSPAFAFPQKNTWWKIQD